ncbi:hypothetical protein [Roseiarcus fermentans]|uniref:hypothetical protein n=1 Tax=Roseiarcus fermentans TaxID=1473586 RepID=UPI001AED0D86|nr:hypothetical protein [Roseiarcus fermentans]
MKPRYLLLPLISLTLVSAATAHEFEHGGALCDHRIDYSMCMLMSKAESNKQVKRLDGWYVSASTLWLGYPRSCIIAGSDTRFEFHAVRQTEAISSNPWVGLSLDDPTYRAMMTHTKWGARIYEVVRDRGWLDTPELHEMTGEEALALGVPRCR